MHEANDRVLEQLRRQQGSYVVEDSEEKPSIVDIEGLKMCDNCGKANSFPIQYAPARHMIVQPFVDIDFFTGTLEAGEHVVLSKLHRNAIVLDIQLWFDTTVSDVRIGNALNDSAYLNVSGYNLLRTSVTDDGTFEGVAFTVGETTEHILLSLGHDFKGSFKVRITYNQ
jgi:hypothetical protein